MKKINFLFFLFFPFLIFSQITITGKILNNNHSPIENVIVQVLDKNGNTLAYGNSDEGGKFSFQINEDTPYSVELNKMGYEKLKKEITVDNNQKSIILEEILSEKITQIEEVKIIGQSTAVKQDGDTITYKTKYFTIGAERNLKDVLNKIPGFDVGGDGQIRVNEKK